MSVKLKQSDFAMIDTYLNYKDNSPCKKCTHITGNCRKNDCAIVCAEYRNYSRNCDFLLKQAKRVVQKSGTLRQYAGEVELYIFCKNKVDEYTQCMRTSELKMKKLRKEEYLSEFDIKKNEIRERLKKDFERFE